MADRCKAAASIGHGANRFVDEGIGRTDSHCIAADPQMQGRELARN